ncbi:MAG: hypothetical protein MI919_31705, partial [Holophagales bacterium]|nr:hypothetical protein [Holophagales bacterium]
MTFSTHTVPAPASHQPIPGLTSIGIQLPPEAVDVPALAPLRGAEPDKYRLGLGCLEMAFCPEGYGIVDLAAGAARRALGRWGGDPARIGLLAVGTETAVDMSRPLSAWVAEELGLSGALRSYEVKHACYGGTLALRQAAEWTASGAGRGKAALVIAADIALYEPGDPGEPTQGAGAVAFVVEDVSAGSDTAVDRACIATLGIDSYAYSEPAFDFWRPVGHSFPSVDGAFSLKCYQKAAEECFRQWQNGRPGHDALATLDAACFHVPFPKMVKKAVVHVGEALGWGDAATTDFFDGRVDPSMVWNRRVGNAYTASLWISVAHALLGRPEGREIAAFS